jgi:hypothetical protein
MHGVWRLLEEVSGEVKDEIVGSYELEFLELTQTRKFDNLFTISSSFWFEITFCREVGMRKTRSFGKTVEGGELELYKSQGNFLRDDINKTS